MKNKKLISLSATLVAISTFAQFASSSAPVVPGEYTDPTNLRRAIKDEMPYETPRDFLWASSHARNNLPPMFRL